MMNMDPNMMNNQMMQNMNMNPAMMNMNMDPSMMNNQMMQNMINMQNMNMNMDPSMMMMMMLMNNQMGGNNNGIDDPIGWNLQFEITGVKTYNIIINENKKVSEAIEKFKKKSSMKDKCDFIFNNKNLSPELTICESGLSNGSKISVIWLKNLKGA